MNILYVLLVFAALASSSPGFAQNPLKRVDPYAGRFDNGQVVLELSGTSGQYSGSMTIQGATLPVKVRTAGALANGTMQVNGATYAFTLTPVPGGLKLASEGSEYILDRRGASGTNTGTQGGVPDRENASGSGERGAIKSGNANGSIVGYWRNAQGYARFNADGTGEVDGQRGRYEIHGKQITLIGANGPVTLPFEVRGDLLTLTFNGVPITLNRAREETGRGGLRPELVGKWCWISVTNAQQGARSSSQCFVLNANGTYQYSGETDSYNPNGGATSQSSDSGTWTATESSITAHSRTQGTKVYRLEKRNHPKNGDPMLVIDGQTFGTYYQKPPW